MNKNSKQNKSTISNQSLGGGQSVDLLFDSRLKLAEQLKSKNNIIVDSRCNLSYNQVKIPNPIQQINTSAAADSNYKLNFDTINIKQNEQISNMQSDIKNIQQYGQINGASTSNRDSSHTNFNNLNQSNTQIKSISDNRNFNIDNDSKDSIINDNFNDYSNKKIIKNNELQSTSERTYRTLNNFNENDQRINNDDQNNSKCKNNEKNKRLKGKEFLDQIQNTQNLEEIHRSKPIFQSNYHQPQLRNNESNGNKILENFNNYNLNNIIDLDLKNKLKNADLYIGKIKESMNQLEKKNWLEQIKNQNMK